MFNPFPTERAEKYCLELIQELESGSQSVKAFKDFTGMFGVLVAKDSLGNEKVLRAFSGQCSSRWNVDGFVPALVDQAEYDKAVLGNDKEIHLLSEAPAGESLDEKKLRDKKRISLCNDTLKKIYSLYRFTTSRGKDSCFNFIQQKIKFNSGAKEEKLFPTGTGDCCAPKLLSYAFKNNLTPVSMTEFYWGKPNTHFEPKKFYPPCDEKCGLILPEILGLRILYRDENIIVVNKPSGLLAVPGRGEDKQDCIVNRVKKLFPDCIEQPSVHRLDMDTSGLMVLAFNAESHRTLSMQFEKGEVQKKYIAVIDGTLGAKINFVNENAERLSPPAENFSPDNPGTVKPSDSSGELKLKFRLDVDNRPHQIYDPVYGKEGITQWKKIRVWKMNGRNVTSVEFIPLTGRTHQLRLAASSRLGFGIPIVGDNLYGHQEKDERLLLHSTYLCFTHPVTGKRMEFFSEPDFKY